MGNKKNRQVDIELADVIATIEKWKDECEYRGENPVCIANFVSLDPKTELADDAMGVIVGEGDEVTRLLAYTNRMLDPDGVKDSSLERLRKNGEPGFKIWESGDTQ